MFTICYNKTKEGIKSIIKKLGVSDLDAVLYSINAIRQYEKNNIIPEFKSQSKEFLKLIKELQKSSEMKQLINESIVITPSIRFGKPVIKGTRIAVEDVIKLIGNGLSVKEIMKEYPSIDEEKKVFAAIAYFILQYVRKNLLLRLTLLFVK